MRSIFGAVLALVMLTGCGGDDEKPGKLGEACKPDEEKACSAGLACDEEKKRCLGDHGFVCTDTPTSCAASLVCDATTAGDSRCYPPVFIMGNVTSAATGGSVSGAHLIALNEERTPVTDVAVSDGIGAYELIVPVVRDATGAPTAAKFTLRVSASGFQTFPSGIRQALPIETLGALRQPNGWHIHSALTRVALIPLDASGLAKVSGSAGAPGVLVVAEAHDGGGAVVAGTGVSGLSDRSGKFTIFNVPPGEWTVRGYRADLQLTPVSVTVGSADVANVALTAAADTPGELTGNIINNSPDFASTSVVLIPKAVFDPVYVRGEVPPGLRAPRTGTPSVTTAFSIAGVPDGHYVVLAAFENDGLVRDESGGGNTAIVEVEVPNDQGLRTFALSASFKVRSALPVLAPGTDEAQGVAATFNLSWGRFSNAKRYDVQVVDALGELVWEKHDIAQPGGSAPITQAYEGPALEAGMIYQFRASAWDETTFPAGNVVSRTEDLRGVFFLQP